MSLPCTRLLSSMLVAVAIAIAGPGVAFAQAASADTVLMSNSIAAVTRADYEAELRKLPIDLRAGFANNPRRVNDLLARMLMQKSLAAQAKAAKLDASPEVSSRMRLEIDRLLAQMLIESVETKAGTEFDADRAKYEARARELYLVDRNSYTIMPEQVSAAHILFDTKKRGADEAKKLAQDTRAKIAAGADFGKLAKELSDDSSAQNNGALGWFAKKDMDPAFGEAAFALKNAGDVSDPVLSQFGWHIIRLDDRRPAAVSTFDEVRETIIAGLKKRYIDDKREETLAMIRRDPKTQVNREAVDALTPRVDIDAVKRALGMTPGGAPPATAPPK